jgi:benzoyl-CoA 2,3-dioxygenase component B
VSSNAADYFAAGIKGRFGEARAYEDHTAMGQFKTVAHVNAGQLEDQEIPLRLAMNEVLRDDYVTDCEKSLHRWNKTVTKQGLDFTFKLPNRRFHRRQGLYAGHHFTLEGTMIDGATFDAHAHEWLPTDDDRAFVESLMKPVMAPGQMANWIAAPRRGINGQSVDHEYVRTDG